MRLDPEVASSRFLTWGQVLIAWDVLTKVPVPVAPIPQRFYVIVLGQGLRIGILLSPRRFS